MVILDLFNVTEFINSVWLLNNKYGHLGFKKNQICNIYLEHSLVSNIIKNS